jgi:purine-binding chemotaxis protein CheW
MCEAAWSRSSILRFASVGRRPPIVIVEIGQDKEKCVLGLVVDRVNAVTEIKSEDIESAPAFGARMNADFISGMARHDGRFVIIMNIERVLSVQELAAVAEPAEAAGAV